MPDFRSPVMVGREPQLESLRAVAARARAGEPATILVIGEAGVGKTRLATELAAELEQHGFLCPASHGVELAGGELSFGATTELLRSLIRSVGDTDVRRLLGGNAHALGALVPALGQPHPASPVDRAIVFGSILTLLEGLQRPVCWVLDDLQWMDSETRDLVIYLSRVLSEVPVLLLTTIRTDTATPSDLPDSLGGLGRIATVVELGPLEADDVSAQVAGILGSVPDADQVARICEVSDGLPFFVEQLVASGGRATGSLRAVVLAALKELSTDARALLDAAAVGEGLLEPALLREVSGLAEGFGAALAENREHGVLRPGGIRDRLQFRHALLREAIDEELLSDQRLALHGAWARVIEDATDSRSPDRLHIMERARHRYAVGGPDAFEATLAAARVVEMVADQELNARWWGRAVVLWPLGAPEQTPDGVTRDWALYRHVMALWSIGRPDEIVRVVTTEREGEADWLRALWLRSLHRHAERALQLRYDGLLPASEAELTWDRLRSRGSDFRVTRVLIDLAADWSHERSDLVPAMLENALERARSDVDHDAALDAFATLGWHEAEHGHPDREIELARSALEWIQANRPSATAAAKSYLTVCLANNGHYREVIGLAETVLHEIGDPRLQPAIWVNENIGLAVAATALGDWDRALVCVASGDIAASGGPVDAGRGWTAVVIHARRGEHALADAELAAIPDSPDDAPRGFSGSMEGIYRALGALEVAASRDDVPAARSASLRVAQLTHPGDAPLDVWEAFAAGMRVGVARASTDGATADYVAAVAGDLEQRIPGGRIANACQPEITGHVARMTDTDTADQWAAVAASWESVGRVYDEAWARLFEAECALRDGDRGGAGSALALSRETCELLGAVPLLEKVNVCARRGRIDLGGTRDQLHGLTARETEVLALLADGRTNAQIAEALFMSAKTASVHVSHIIAKLGVANRTEAAAQAHRLGLVGARSAQTAVD